MKAFFTFVAALTIVLTAITVFVFESAGFNLLDPSKCVFIAAGSFVIATFVASSRKVFRVLKRI